MAKAKEKAKKRKRRPPLAMGWREVKPERLACDAATPKEEWKKLGSRAHHEYTELKRWVRGTRFVRIVSHRDRDWSPEKARLAAIGVEPYEDEPGWRMTIQGGSIGHNGYISDSSFHVGNDDDWVEPDDNGHADEHDVLSPDDIPERVIIKARVLMRAGGFGYED